MSNKGHRTFNRLYIINSASYQDHLVFIWLFFINEACKAYNKHILEVIYDFSIYPKIFEILRPLMVKLRSHYF